MNHFILLILCIFSVEALIRSNYFKLINSTIKVSKKALFTILNKNISDHWKEKIVPKYSIQMMKYSFQMLSILFFIIFLFFVVDFIFDDLIKLTFSLKGIIEAILFSFIYVYLRKLIKK